MGNLVLGFCGWGLVFGVVSSLVDITKFEKEIKTLFTAIVLIYLLQTLNLMDTTPLDGISLDVNPYPLESISTEDYTRQEVTAQVERSVEEYLDQNGVVCESISVGVDISDSGSISITSITLITDDFPKAKALLLGGFGEGITVREG
jgi:hypothetical protein